MIKVVFFDVGGTLVYPHPSVGGIYSRVAERHGLQIAEQDLNSRFKDAWKKNKTERSPVDKAWWKRVVTDVFDGFSFKQPDAFFEDLYLEFEKPDAWRVFPDVHETLTALKTKDIRLAICSNWDSRLPKLLKTLDLEKYFERQFISFDLKVAKPDSRFFKHALQEMATDPLEALHVGDDPEEDIAGAQQVGMRAYFIDRLHKPKNSRTLSALTDILLRI